MEWNFLHLWSFLGSVVVPTSISIIVILLTVLASKWIVVGIRGNQ